MGAVPSTMGAAPSTMGIVSTTMPMFGRTIYDINLPQQYQHLKDQEFCVLIHQNPSGHQTDGVCHMGKKWYNPPPPQQQSYSINNTCGPPIPKNKHVNIKIYGTYNNIKNRNYDQLKHTSHYEYDGSDVYKSPTARNIAFQSFQQFAEFYNECKTHQITSQFMSLPTSDWYQSSIYSYSLHLGIVTSIDHTKYKKPIKLQQLTINNNNNTNNNTNSIPVTTTTTTSNNPQDIPTFMHNITSWNVIALSSSYTYYIPPCIGWVCLVVVDSMNQYHISYPLLDLGEKVVVNNNNNISSLISQCSPPQQQALYEVVHYWQNVEKNKKQYNVQPIPQYNDVNPYDYINIVKQAPIRYPRRIVEEKKRITEETKRITEEQKAINCSPEEKLIAQEEQNDLQLQKQQHQQEYANNIRYERLINKPLILQAFNGLIRDEQILDRFIQDEYQKNCLVLSSSSNQERQEDTYNDNIHDVIKYLFTLAPSTLSNVNNIIVHDYILYLKQTLEHMKYSLTNEVSSHSDGVISDVVQLQQQFHNNPNNNHNESILNQHHYKYQSYLRREYNIKYRSQCTSISQTTIDSILNNTNTLHIEPSTNDDNNNQYTSSNIMSTATSSPLSFIRPYTTLLSHQLALTTTYATMRNNQLHFTLAQQDSKQKEEEEEEQQQQQKKQQQPQEQNIVMYDDIDKDQQHLSQHHDQEQCQQSEVEFLREQLKAKDQQLKAKDQQLQFHQQQLKAKDQQLKAKDQQLKLKDVQLQDSQQQLNRKDQQIAMVMTLLLEQSNNSNNNNNHNEKQ